jgi:hypothetical protein
MRPPQPLLLVTQVASHSRKIHNRMGGAHHLSNTTFANARPSLDRCALMGWFSSTERITSLNSDTNFAVIAAASSDVPL